MSQRLKKDLEKLYELALGQENLSLALKIKELEAKLLLNEKSNPLPKSISLKDLSDQELESILGNIEAYLEEREETPE